MTRARRPVLVVLLALGLFVAPGVAAYAYWSTTATGSLSVTTAPPTATVIKYYLENPGSGNTGRSAVLAMSTTPPTATSLPDYDGDGQPGLLVKAGGGAGDTDPEKHQRWSTGPLTVVATTVKLRLWNDFKDRASGKSGSIAARLMDCPNDTSNQNACQVISTVTVPRSSTGTWAATEWNFGQLSFTIATGRRLQVKVAPVGEDMWFAYDTAAQPSALEIG